MADQTNSTPIATSDLEEKLTLATQKTKDKIHQDPAKAQTLAATPALQDEVVDIEKKLLNEIVTRLKQNKMTPEEAQKLTKEFLSLLPIQDQKDLLTKLTRLSKDNNAISGIYLHYAKPYEENETKRKLELMSQHLHLGKIEEALAVAKGEPQNA